MPANNPVAILPAYPSTPVICPAKEEIITAYELKCWVQICGRKDKRITVHLSITDKFSIIQSWYQPEYTPLLRKGQVSLEF